VTPEDEKSAPRTSAKGKKRADEKYARQAEALRANLHRRKQQQRGTSDNEQEGGETDAE
jgi:hypothetical protein